MNTLKTYFIYIIICTNVTIVNACTYFDSCLTDCPAPPNMGIQSRPWCKLSETGYVATFSNIPASWTIYGSGSSNFTTWPGYGSSQWLAKVPEGLYTIIWNDVYGYTKPATETIFLESGNLAPQVKFDGVYILNSPTVRIYFSLFMENIAEQLPLLKNKISKYSQLYFRS